MGLVYREWVTRFLSCTRRRLRILLFYFCLNSQPRVCACLCDIYLCVSINSSRLIVLTVSLVTSTTDSGSLYSSLSSLKPSHLANLKKHLHTHTRTHTHTHTYTHARTHIHTHTEARVWRLDADTVYFQVLFRKFFRSLRISA